MKLAFCLFKYFPFGGLQRDFLRIAAECLRRGHTVHVYTMAWQGDRLPGLNIHIIPCNKWSNHQRCLHFSNTLKKRLLAEHFDLVVGFNKIAGLDVYYAADPCYHTKVAAQRKQLYRLSPRYRAYAHLEEAVFGDDSYAEVLLITAREAKNFQQCYDTPPQRMHLLPPGIAQDRRAPADAQQIRQALREEFNIPRGHQLILMVGSGFKTKGVDRALLAFAALPDTQRRRTQLMIIGQDEARVFKAQARALGISECVKFLGGRDDVPRFLWAADLLLHPAYYENAGMVLLEALVAGLPVLTTAICGYAEHIEKAGAGIVLAEPFLQAELNQQLLHMLSSPDKTIWQQNALAYAAQTDLYSLPERAVDLLERFYKERNPVSGPVVLAEAVNTVPDDKILLTPAIVQPEVFNEEIALAAPQAAPTAAAASFIPKVHTDSPPEINRRTNKFLNINRGFTRNTHLPWYKNCLELNEDLKEFWHDEHGEDVFAKIWQQGGKVYRAQKNRRTLAFNTAKKSYFIKLHEGVGWREIFKNLLQLRAPILGAQPEWRALARLHELGIDTAKLAGFGSRGSHPAKLQSFVVMEALHNTISLEDFCRVWPKTPPAPQLKWTLIKEVARIARVLHGNGICHRDFYLCHFLLDITNGAAQLNPNFIRLTLIDLHRMREAKVFLAQRWVIKDLAALYFSCLEIALHKRDLLRFIKHYRGGKLRSILKAEKGFWARVNWRAKALYGKEKWAAIDGEALNFPLNFALADGSLLMGEQALRVLPHQRWVMLAQWPHQQIVAKLYADWRQAQRELKGYEILAAAGVSTPQLISHDWVAGEKLYALLFTYIYPARNYADILEENKTDLREQLSGLIHMLAQMHEAGVQQTNLQLKSFLANADKSYVLDPAHIKASPDKRALSEEAGLKNLGLLLAQLPRAGELLIGDFYTLYAQSRKLAFTLSNLVKLKKWIKYWRRWWLFKRKAEVLRPSSHTICRRNWWRFSLCERSHDSKAMQVFLRNPDAVLDSSFAKPLKLDKTSTVAMITIEGKHYVVKRYNIKGFWHGLKRAVRPSRAAISWCSAQLLQFLEIPTAKPIAMMERRYGPLRHTAYYISEYLEGITLLEYFNHKHERVQDELIASKLKKILKDLAEANISHGDLKATNILLVEQQPVLLDLDAMRLHRFTFRARRAIRRDLRRFLRNWAGRPKVLQLFQA